MGMWIVSDTVKFWLITDAFFFLTRTNGVRLTASAGTTEFAKRWDPKPGDIVTFKHHGFLFRTKKPKFPTLHRLRQDITWQDVVNNWKEQKVSTIGMLLLFSFSSHTVYVAKIFSPMATAPPLRKPAIATHKPKGYWMDKNNLRKVLIEYAEEAGFDPYDVESWKRVRFVDFVAKKVGNTPFLRIVLFPF